MLLAFDSDVMVKRFVHGALERAAKLLSSRGAVVLFVYLPTTWEGRVGVDDWLARGGTVEQLYAIAEDVLRELPPEPKPKRAVSYRPRSCSPRSTRSTGVSCGSARSTSRWRCRCG